MSSISGESIPDEPPLSPGSSVSTRLQDEYDELLKFAVVVPKYDPSQVPQSLVDTKESFLQRSAGLTASRGQEEEEDGISEATDVTPMNVDGSQNGLPDFGGESPIGEGAEDSRPHDPIPSHYFISQLRNQCQNMNTETSHSNLVEHGEYDRVGEYERVYTSTVDPDVSKLETMMDQWCLDLKRNVIAEFSQSKIRIVEQGRQLLIKEQERHASEKMKMLSEINNLKELLATYEKSIARKDQVISNLTGAMQKQRDKNEMTKRFCEWKLRHSDYKREAFCSVLARKHYERQLSHRVWDAWHSVIESKWRQRIEKACQAKAQEVCVQLTDDYEAKLKMANEALAGARQEVTRLYLERDKHQEMMKKAFMRGVCALNMEAMTMFHHGEEKENRADNLPGPGSQDDMMDNMTSSMPDKDYSSTKSLPSETPAYSITKSLPTEAPISIVAQPLDRISPRGHHASTGTGKPSSAKSKASSSKVLTSKVTSKIDCGKPRSRGGGQGLGPSRGGGQALGPPMSSVVVERHQPVTKETVGHAVAGKYPRPGTAPPASTQGGPIHRKIAGQGIVPSPSIQTVKHVE